MGVGQAAVDKVSKGLRKSFQFLFGHAPTGRGTIFISRNKFLSSRGRELAAGPADEQRRRSASATKTHVGQRQADCGAWEVSPGKYECIQQP
jgi:hypothetical protein